MSTKSTLFLSDDDSIEVFEDCSEKINETHNAITVCLEGVRIEEIEKGRHGRLSFTLTDPSTGAYKFFAWKTTYGKQVCGCCEEEYPLSSTSHANLVCNNCYYETPQ